MGNIFMKPFITTDSLSMYSKLCLLLLAFFLVQSCANTDAYEPEENLTASVSPSVKVTPVRVAEVKYNSNAIPIRATGMIATQEERKLSFKIGGIIERVLVNEGQFVKKGKILAQLNKIEIDAQTRQTNSAVEKAKRDLQRVQNLYADSVATLENMEDLTTALEVATANRDIAQFNQQYANIKAPTSGKILKILSQSNEIVGPGMPIFLFAANNSAQVLKVGLTDVEVVSIQKGDHAAVSFDAYPQEIFSARINEIAELANPRTGTYEVELSIDRKGKKLKNGFIGKAELFPKSSNGHYQIPIDAIVEGNRETIIVYAPAKDGEGVEQYSLAVLSIQPDYVAVQSPQGTLPFDQVITDGAKYLTKNAKIKIVY